MLMKQVTLNDHPDFIAVIDGRTDLAAAMAAARDALLDPAYQAAVIVRESETAGQSADRAADLLKTMSPNRDELGRLADGRFAVMRAKEKSQDVFAASDFNRVAGHDVTDLLTAMDGVFASPPAMYVRVADGDNANGHLDSGYEFMTPNFSGDFSRAAPTPGGITLTMALRGGGTIVRELSRDELIRVPGHNGQDVWRQRDDVRDDDIGPNGAAIADHLGWQTRAGDVCLMRGGDWPETHLPTLHASPIRQRQGDPKERVVCLAFL
ncbi:hypothetical protein [Micavibrio aeruginosavorus]|uniref:hypothetical protein n=1 Tax=Micavibrio aeruginosavorus TaxID=349221 RepID=UPI003F4ACF60